jgi:DNA-binding transcriptional LysR family regulator
MELRQLRYFVAVAETGNISRAAQKIFLTQPALSRQIQALEAEIGQCLLERRANSVGLTPAGEVMLREARDLLRQAEQAVERVKAAGTGGRLRIGYAPSLAEGLMTPAVTNFTQAHPGTQVEMSDLSTGEMLAGLEAAKLDVVVSVAQERHTRGLHWTPLARLPWRLAVGSGHPLARSARVRPGALAGEPLLSFRRHDYPDYWAEVTAWLHRHGLRPRIAGEYDGGNSLLAAVAAGLGVALIGSRPAHLVPKGVRLKNLTEAPSPVCIAAGCRADRADDKPLAVFLAELRRAAGSLK